MKRFNVTGICIPSKHYMVDTSSKIQKIVTLINDGSYFVINRPRQFGKTTTLFLLENALFDKYLVINVSFEGMGEEAFENIAKLSQEFIFQLQRALKVIQEQELLQYIQEQEFPDTLGKLSLFITNLIIQSQRKVVLIIDEVDKASNHIIFLNFLGMLRNKFLNRERGEVTFQSVVLAGVHDIKNIKKKLRPDSDSQYNSPWNIATEFKIDMSFSAKEIETMLNQWTIDNEQLAMDMSLISAELYNYTSGYPFLVSKICKVIDEDLDRDWSSEGVQKAINIILESENTLFDDLIKNLENHKDLYDLVYMILIEGIRFPYEIYNPLINLGTTFGILTKRNGVTTISNKIFEICIYNYMISKSQTKEKSFSKHNHQFLQNGSLNMEQVLNKFQEIMQDEYRDKDNKFIEREGRLLFLCFLKPIINGKGFYFVEPETREGSRMDIVLVYEKEEFIIELKIWHGKKKEEESLEQLYDYLEKKRKEKGYLLVFNFNQNKRYSQEWVKCRSKDVYKVEV